MGIQALKSHQKGKKHISVVSNMSCFFKSSFAKDPPVSVEESTSKVNDSSSSRQQTLELNVLSPEKYFCRNYVGIALLFEWNF